MIDPQQDIEFQIISKSKEDATFKQQLLSNPKATLEQELGQPLPEDLEIEVVQQTPHKLYIVLPLEMDQLAQAQAQELSEEELEAVSGGSGLACTIALTQLALAATKEFNCLP